MKLSKHSTPKHSRNNSSIPSFFGSNSQLSPEDEKERLDSLSRQITVMHPGPINRGVEITSDVADSKQAIILDQVENGVAIRMAVLYLLANSIKK